MKVNTGVPQGSKLSPSLFIFYIADMPRPTEPVQRVCYADDLTVWDTGVNIPDLNDSINSYLDEITAYLKDNSLLIYAPVFSHVVHPGSTLSQFPSENTHLSFNKHSINNIIKALASTSWGQQKETLLMTYKALGRSIINYAAPVWSANTRDTNYRNIQYTQNEALRIATGCHKMSSVDHLHAEVKMLKVREHSELLSAQYLARCMVPGNVCHSITTRETPKRR